jgi:hypothetical protein
MSGVFDVAHGTEGETRPANILPAIQEPQPPRDIDYVAEEARRRERKTYVFLAILVAVAIAAVGAGVVADNNVFWAITGSVFFMSCAGLVAYAATGLGVVAAMLDIIRFAAPHRSEQATTAPVSRASDGGQEVVAERRAEPMAEPQPTSPNPERERTPAEGEEWRL